jgi:hypothetical protein
VTAHIHCKYEFSELAEFIETITRTELEEYRRLEPYTLKRAITFFAKPYRDRRLYAVGTFLFPFEAAEKVRGVWDQSISFTIRLFFYVNRPERLDYFEIRHRGKTISSAPGETLRSEHSSVSPKADARSTCLVCDFTEGVHVKVSPYDQVITRLMISMEMLPPRRKS